MNKQQPAALVFILIVVSVIPTMAITANPSPLQRSKSLNDIETLRRPLYINQKERAYSLKNKPTAECSQLLNESERNLQLKQTIFVRSLDALSDRQRDGFLYKHSQIIYNWARYSITTTVPVVALHVTQRYLQCSNGQCQL